MKKRTICVAMLLSLLVLLLAGCGETDQSRYENAQSLMAKGQFAEAAGKFEELGSYEESAKLSMYCKALLEQERPQYLLQRQSLQLT